MVRDFSSQRHKGSKNSKNFVLCVFESLCQKIIVRIENKRLTKSLVTTQSLSNERDKIMSHSANLEKAIMLIDSAKGKELSAEERRVKAIELAALMLNEGRLRETPTEKKLHKELGRMMDDPAGKVFTMDLTDQCFRTKNNWRIADQILFLTHYWGIPQYLSSFKKMQLRFFRSVGKVCAPLLVPLIKRLLHKECSRFILPGENTPLLQAIQRWQKKGLRINLNHLGEAILGEEEAQRRMEIYLADLRRPEVEYISVKVSTICSQLDLIAWEETLSLLTERFKLLLHTAYENYYTKPDGTRVPKFVNLDMEEYRDLDLTVELFKRGLDDPACLKYSAGIVLQSYIPDSYLVQQDLTVWAMQRMAKGGAPIKIRIVKGANLAMEQVEASLHGWPQAPYPSKAEVDANFKRMLLFACQKEHAQAAHIGIGSHNLFDIAYGLLLRAENELGREVGFEMLEGMAESQKDVVQDLAGDMLLYCPAAAKSEFQNAVAYLIRRLDENTSPENFLRQVFKLQVGSPEWQEQADMFSKSCENSKTVSLSPRRTQNRFNAVEDSTSCEFENEQDTDWSLSQNRLWAQKILKDWSQRPKEAIPLVIGGKALSAEHGLEEKIGFNPSDRQKVFYTYALAGDLQIDEALKSAVAAQDKWGATTVEHRSEVLRNVAQQLREHRAELVGAMVADTAKVITEADVEISEAIDFVEYYRRNIEEVCSMQDIAWHPKGPVLVAPPWNFPCSIPVGGIAAALAAGNSVIFKPAPEAVLVGWTLVRLFWQGGIGKDVLQFINCEDEPYGSHLVQDPRLAIVVLTGATSTAKHFLKMRADIGLIAETGGKNAIIVSNLADRDQAVKDIVQSAFGHAGQKCSACSLVICPDEVYNDPQFRRQLRDAAASWTVGTPWNPATRLNPLIRPPGETLKRGLSQLEAGEEWLLEPKQDPHNPCLWSPGIKLGVRPGSFTQQNELFGPVLGLMQADNLEQAIHLANQINYGLTSGLHSLDLREQKYWSERIEAGNCYINRGITGAIVQRQPFGGWKDSCFSPGAKAGGPNYLMQFMRPEQLKLPQEREKLSSEVEALSKMLETYSQQELWRASAESYTFYWKHYFSQSHDPSLVQGEDNFLRYVPRKNMNLRVLKGDDSADVLRAITAAMICGCDLTISCAESLPFKLTSIAIESNPQFLARLKWQSVKRVRFFTKPEPALSKALAELGCYTTVAPVLTNGRIELLRYLREQSLTVSYHRYGNLGEREGEPRKSSKCSICTQCP